MVPNRSSASESPATAPGTATARAPMGCSATTMPRGAGGVRFVTISCEWITGDSGNEVLRDVDHRRLLEVEAPDRRVHPGFRRVRALHRGPVRAGQLLHLRCVR